MQSLIISRPSNHMHRPAQSAGQLTCKPIAMLVAGVIALVSAGSHAADAKGNANGQNFARGRSPSRLPHANLRKLKR